VPDTGESGENRFPMVCVGKKFAIIVIIQNLKTIRPATCLLENKCARGNVFN